MTNACEKALRREQSRCQNDPASRIDMSITSVVFHLAGGSPFGPLAGFIDELGCTNNRNETASIMIISGPSTNSATLNCQPISRAKLVPNSNTRLVELISNTMAGVKLAPLRNSGQAKAATA